MAFTDRKLYSFIIVLFLLLNFSCKKEEKPSRAFYYWKSIYDLDETTVQKLSDLSVNKIYVRFFDVEWNKKSASPVPVQPIKFQDTPLSFVEYIPVVYIVNSALIECGGNQIPWLAKRLEKQIEIIAKQNNIDVKELQIDCDWTESTREKYFSLLRELKNFFEGKITATIRLHQIKYPERTGIPPCDKGMLMFYNMGSVENVRISNSIFDSDIAKKYTSYISSYELPLDVVLPAFSWVVHTRDGKIMQLLSSFDPLAQGNKMRRISNHLFVVDSTFLYSGKFFRQGDSLFVESAGEEELQSSAEQVSEKLPRGLRTVAIFDLDSTFFLKHNEKEIKAVYSLFE